MTIIASSISIPPEVSQYGPAVTAVFAAAYVLPPIIREFRTWHLGVLKTHQPGAVKPAVKPPRGGDAVQLADASGSAAQAGQASQPSSGQKQPPPFWAKVAWMAFNSAAVIMGVGILCTYSWLAPARPDTQDVAAMMLGACLFVLAAVNSKDRDWD